MDHSLVYETGLFKASRKRSGKTTFPVHRDYTYLVDSCLGQNSHHPGTRSFALLPSKETITTYLRKKILEPTKTIGNGLTNERKMEYDEETYNIQ